jgi:hypothetical protein
VARAGRGSGFLALDVSRERRTAGEAKLRIEVEVANFYPAIAAEFSMPAYMATQAFVHVLVTHAFLRSLAKLSLAESKVKALANLGRVVEAARAERVRRLTTARSVRPRRVGAPRGVRVAHSVKTSSGDGAASSEQTAGGGAASSEQAAGERAARAQP